MSLESATIPKRCLIPWSVSIAVGAVGLGMLYGFDEPIVNESAIRKTLIVAAGFFAISRMMLLIPPATAGPRLKRWWVDFSLIALAVGWYLSDPSRLPIILTITAAYSIVIAFGTSIHSGIRGLMAPANPGYSGHCMWRLVVTAMVITIAAGGWLSMPVCWTGAHPIEMDSYAGQIRYEWSTHAINCLFTAAAALTGTGLRIYDIGSEFTRMGQWTLLGLMQLGGLAALTAGSVIGWRIRRLIGWCAPEDEDSPIALGRTIAAICVGALLIEAVAAILFMTWVPTTSPSGGSWTDQLLEGVFLAVSAFCNVGLTLSRDSMIHAGALSATCSVVLPLMILGSIGGPALLDLIRRISGRASVISMHTRIVLVSTVVLIVGGAALILAIESTPTWQLRSAHEETPGQLLLHSTPTTTRNTTTETTPDPTPRSDQMQHMSFRPRLAAALFQSVAARTGGMQTVRMDEQSLSPASRFVLIMWMLVGGALGGTAGGMRIMVWFLLMIAIFGRNRRRKSPGRFVNQAGMAHLTRAAGAVAASMFLLVGTSTVVLVYRQAGSLDECLFEAVSATCNVGYSAGLTSQLPMEDRLSGDTGPISLRFACRTMLILAMILGKVLPIGFFLRAARSAGPGMDDPESTELIRSRLATPEKEPPLRDESINVII